MHVDEHTIEVAAGPVYFRRAAAADDGAPPATPLTPAARAAPLARSATPLYLHSVPTSSDDWVPFLEATGGIAPDLIGFGRSSKAGNLDYSIAGYLAFLEELLGAAGLERVALVGHGWGGAIALAFALRHPDRVDRVVLIDALPLLEGFAWPAMVRWWRRPAIGELLMGSVNRRLLTRTLRAGTARPDAWPDDRLAVVWDQFDQGTQRAILRLHRSIDEPGLALLGTDLGDVQPPALILWGERDPWLPPAFADAYAARLPDATVEHVPGAGHWPWLEQPGLVTRVAEFLAAR
jgi:pimeloyl-ACP methyl ester carboxylesterase